MLKPEIAIQMDSEKPIIADQKRIFLTNKKAFTKHGHCPKCNDSMEATSEIQSGIGKRKFKMLAGEKCQM